MPRIEPRRRAPLKKSKMIEAAVNKNPLLDRYYVEECDGKAQHWVHTVDGYLFPDMECGTVNGFSVNEILIEIADICSEQEFYGDDF